MTLLESQEEKDSNKQKQVKTSSFGFIFYDFSGKEEDLSIFEMPH